MLVPGCKCCLSRHLEFIENCFRKEMTTRQISVELKSRFGASISHSSIARHYKNHYLPKVQNRGDPLDQLNGLGQSRLKRAILRGIKYSKTHHRCSCVSLRPLRRMGIIYVCGKCGGWVPAYEARRIKKMQRKEKKKEPERSVLLLRQRTRH